MAITYDTAMQVYFGMYAVTMSTFPDEIWGKGGLGQLPYWAKPLGDAMTHGGFFARIVGMCFGLIVFGRRHCGVTADAFSKQTIAFHVASLIPFGNLALNANPNWTQWAWQVQVTMNVVLALWGAQATGLLGGGGAKKPAAKRSARKRA
jgi:hypothetical protein|mmetsp:Transcript_10421/g.34473  ORF Transcript_10421/g.34473 Transcript_10421/m.34473 type:complete len:149 (-) Transcript_10421:154-600(-)